MDLSHVTFHGKPADRRHGAKPLIVRPAPRGAGVIESDNATSLAENSLLGFVLARASLDPAAYRPRPLERRLGACLRALRARSEVDARGRLESHPELRDVALTLRIWSIGCSTGAELYSVAILLAEAQLLNGACLVGTDCRTDAVERAREGVFSDEALAAVDPACRMRYFERTLGGWRVVDSLRRLTTWHVADATREMSEGPWDIVLCRNLAIYLQAQYADAMFRRMSQHISAGGFLVVGKAERPAVSLPLLPTGCCVYRRHEV
ncbi:MAG TPA: CheR family methyltransferase [Vicinamibacterales bacterium]|nr:CheR family methyltransferase [Vicinamibacterales bacterium]